MNEMGFCPVVSGVMSSGVLSCGVLSVWGFVLWVLSVHHNEMLICLFSHYYTRLLYPASVSPAVINKAYHLAI